MNNFRKYKVQKGETIEAIATKIGIPAFDLRAYHNRYCELSDLVELGLPIKWAEYILLPPLESNSDTQISEIDNPKKVKLGYDNSLHLIVENDIKQEYGTIILYKENGRLTNKVHFTSQIEFLRRDHDFFIVEYHINQVYINNKEPEMVIEQLADKTSKILYPIVMSLNMNGEIHEILNIDAIQQRWQNLKPSILEYYKGGDVITKLLSSFETIIKSAPLLKKNLMENPFYAIYFAPIYQNYSTDLSFKKNESTLETFQKVEEFQTRTSKILVRRKGISKTKTNLDKIQEKQKSLQDEIFEVGKIEDGVNINMDFEYKLDHSSNSIFSIVGFVNTRKNDKTIASIEFETYQKVEKKEKREINIIEEGIDWNSQIINEKIVKKRSLWDEFWGN